MEALSQTLLPYKDTVGEVAGFVTLLQFLSGSALCYDIYKKKSTRGISAMPFVGGIYVGILVLKFAMILQDKNMFNVNVAAIVLNAIYILFYISYSKNKSEEVWKPVVKGAVLTSVLIGYSVMEDPSLVEHRYGLIVTVIMLLLMGSPLVETKNIIAKKDASSIPFPLTVMGFFVTVLWLLYGIILLNYFMIVQNFIGALLCVLQLILFFTYPPPKGKKE